MDEVYRAVKPRSTRVSEVSLSKSKLPRLGGFHNKERVEVSVTSNSGRERSLPMVNKRLSYPEDAKEYSEYWKELVDAELPTIPTVRIIGENDVLITDFTADGSMFYGKYGVYPTFDRFRQGRLSSLDKIFLSINPEEIKKKAEQIAQQANKKNVYLPHDDPFDILVHPDGTWEIIVLDLMRSKFSHIVEKNNSKCVDKLVQYVTWMREGLTGTGKPPTVVS